MQHSKDTASIVTLLLIAVCQTGWSQQEPDTLPRRGYFGVALAERSDDGVLITAVNENTTAFDMGVTAGDVILAVDGEPTNSASEVQAAIGSRRSGDEVSLTILRADDSIELVAALRSIPLEVMQNAVVEYGSVTTDQGVTRTEYFCWASH